MLIMIDRLCRTIAGQGIKHKKKHNVEKETASHWTQINIDLDSMFNPLLFIRISSTGSIRLSHGQLIPCIMNTYQEKNNLRNMSRKNMRSYYTPQYSYDSRSSATSSLTALSCIKRSIRNCSSPSHSSVTTFTVKSFFSAIAVSTAVSPSTSSPNPRAQIK